MPAEPRHSTPFTTSPQIAVMAVGEEREPVVVVDRATGWLDRLRDAAASAAFAAADTIGSHYPGLLAPAPVAYLDGLVRFALPLIAAHFGTGAVMPARARGNFSLVTLPGEALSAEQRVPHVDAADRMQFAAVHYLSDSPDGTGFFRHRATGYETIDPDRLPAYRAALDAELAALPAGGYMDEDDARFVRTAAVAAKPDRLILYRAALLHSGLISRLPRDAADPRAGRLTGNLFLQCRTAAA
ncbi:DUF6445 family protein [Sphingomonas sp. MA1305]|uniref:DUF6445 family protein n=1 Tax=Sphingomonas sp. MA1305 TaxID=2479204 RepID=UPI0018DEFF91|nr:DUF6445 family protein [Sphingomonas sp. MA1305]